VSFAFDTIEPSQKKIVLDFVDTIDLLIMLFVTIFWTNFNLGSRKKIQFLSPFFIKIKQFCLIFVNLFYALMRSFLCRIMRKMEKIDRVHHRNPKKKIQFLGQSQGKWAK
jgi:hypothetical protein